MLFRSLEVFVFLATVAIWVRSYTKIGRIDVVVRRQLYSLGSERGSIVFSGPPVASESELVEASRRISVLTHLRPPK
jgi:hypothetical protein